MRVKQSTEIRHLKSLFAVNMLGESVEDDYKVYPLSHRDVI